MDLDRYFFWILAAALHTEYYVRRVLFSDVIFMVNLGGNVSETVILSLRDSVIGVIENMVPSIKNVRKQVSDMFLNQENISKAFFLLIPPVSRRFLQKTTWATIMSRNDKTWFIQYLMTKKLANFSVKCNSKSPYVLCIRISKDIGHI